MDSGATLHQTEELFLDCLDVLLDSCDDFSDPAHLWDVDSEPHSLSDKHAALFSPNTSPTPPGPASEPATAHQWAVAPLEQHAAAESRKPGAQHFMDGPAVAGRPPVSKPPRVQLWDKLAFVLGSTCLWMCAYWLGHSPSSFYYLYTVLGGILFTARYVVYRARKWHYYLLDMCYACNALLMVHLWVAPRSRRLARITFAFNTGPLTTSILAFRNSLVYHDMDKVTSLFLHLVPACVSWALRHSPASEFGQSSSGAAGFQDLVAVPLACYCIWAVLYWVTIFGIAADRIKRRGYTTLFTYVTTRKRGTFAAITRRVAPHWRPVVYLLLHCCFCGVSMLLSWFAWQHQAFHTVVLVLATSWATYQGSCFYFEVFARSHNEPTAS